MMQNKISELLPKRLTSLIRYLGWADAPYKWRFSCSDCPLCGKSVFLSLKSNPFMTRCLRCKANITNLSLIPVIQSHFCAEYSGLVAYELSTYGSTLCWMRNNFNTVITSEFFPDRKLGEVVDGCLNQDVQNLTFDDNIFDLVTSNQVFEHVPDDIKGYRECFRVLRKGGALIFSVPLYDIKNTEQIAYLTDKNIVFVGEPEYHDSRLSGAKSAPTFWHHSFNDISKRVASAGFSKVQLVDVTIAKSQRTPEKVICAVK
ncbi:class I SAM-dependent methyltransferase [Mycetohabitans rhizoxinica]